MAKFLDEREFPDGFSLSTKISCTALDILNIVEHVWDCSGMQLEGTWNEDDVRIAIRETLGGDHEF
jgi:hypothetical protein